MHLDLVMVQSEDLICTHCFKHQYKLSATQLNVTDLAKTSRQVHTTQEWKYK